MNNDFALIIVGVILGFCVGLVVYDGFYVDRDIVGLTYKGHLYWEDKSTGKICRTPIPENPMTPVMSECEE